MSDRGSKFKMDLERLARNSRRPWEGPLPTPRILPMRSLGDVMKKAKVRHFTPSVDSPSCRGASMILHPKRRLSGGGQRKPTRSLKQGDVSGRGSSKFES
jgi:hypothetical protein